MARKGPAHQKYIMLHDTEGESGPRGRAWTSGTATGTWWPPTSSWGETAAIVQCVPARPHCAPCRFRRRGPQRASSAWRTSRATTGGASVPIGGLGARLRHELAIPWASSWCTWAVRGSIREAQLEALDALIAYIDAYYGFESADHRPQSLAFGQLPTPPPNSPPTWRTTKRRAPTMAGRLRLRLARVRRRKTVAFPSKRCAFCANACMLAGRAAALRCEPPSLRGGFGRVGVYLPYDLDEPLLPAVVEQSEERGWPVERSLGEGGGLH